MTTSPILDDWRQRPAVLATMHGKETIIGPVLAEVFGMTVTVPMDFNTDQFGTFTGDVKRTGTQLEAARKKALAAMELTGSDLALASEGRFGELSTLPFLPSSLELVVLIDKKHGFEIVGHHRTSSLRAKGQTVTSVTEAVAVAKSWGFPDQGIIISTSASRACIISKDVSSLQELEVICTRHLKGWWRRGLFLETDMRAHRCPARHTSIRAATENLIAACQSLCPKCSAPGFIVTETKTGLPCATCGRETDGIQTYIYTCQKCQHRAERPSERTMADPSQCEWCNP